jgi:N12 class adenine-specific DNA methylase
LQLKAANQFLPLILSLSDQQKSELVDTLRDKNAQFAKDYVYIGEVEARIQNAAKLQSQLEKWLGYLTPQQKGHIKRFANDYQWIAPSSFDARQRRLAYFEHQLFQTNQSENADLFLVQQLTNYQAFWDDGLVQAFAVNKQYFSEMFAAVLQDSEPRQINKLIKRLEGYKKL